MKIQGKQLADILRDENNPFEELYADSLVGDLNGAIHFEAKNVTGAEIAKGVPVYINGISGDGSGKPTIAKADATASNSAMPAFGLTATAISNNSVGKVTTFGTLEGLNTSAFSAGDILYVDTTAGQLTNTAPTGSGAKLQNIGIVLFSDASTGAIRVGGAGRTNATPNLDNGKFFIGDSNNQSSQSAYGLPLSDGTEGQILVSNGMGQLNFANPSSSAMTVETKTANFSAQTNYFYLVSTTSGSTIEVTVPSSPTVGDRIKVFNTGAGTVRVAENTGNLSVNPHDSSGGVSGTSRSVNSKALIELVAITTQQWSYVLIPQIELDSDTLTTTGEFLIYKASELALKPAPYAMPDSSGSTGQLLAVSSTNTSELDFIDPSVPFLEYTSLVSNLAAANFGGTNYRRPYYYPNITNLTITLPLYTDSNSSSLNGQVIKIINESGYTVGLYISSTNHGSSSYTRLRDSTGELSPFSGSYTYTIPACTSIDLSVWRGSVGANSFLFYSIIG